MSLPEHLALLTTLLDTTGSKLDAIITELKKLNDVENGFTFSKVYFKRLANITGQSKPADASPSYEIYSLDTDVIIKSIAVIPDATFKTKGILLIEVNGVPFFSDSSPGDFTDINSFTIPLPEEGLKLQRSKKMRFYVWTSDGTASALTITALVSKDVKNLT